MRQERHEHNGFNARKPKVWEAECCGKTPYATKAKAIERIKHQVRNRRRRKKAGFHTVLVPYRCPHCHQWHAGGTDRMMGRRYD